MKDIERLLVDYFEAAGVDVIEDGLEWFLSLYDEGPAISLTALAMALSSAERSDPSTDTIKHMWDQIEKARSDGTFTAPPHLALVSTAPKQFSESESAAYLYARAFPKREWCQRFDEAIRKADLDSATQTTRREHQRSG